MKARLVLAVTEHAGEYEYERHYKSVDVEVLPPYNEDELAKCDILGGHWLQLAVEE